jgi:hypothetical protein
MRVSRTILINGAIAVLACASGVAVYATSRSVTTKDSEGREQNLLPVFRTEDVIGLDLSANGKKISLQRAAASDAGAASFELTSPVKELADAATVDKFLNGLASAKALRPVADGPTRATLGLDASADRIAVRTEKLSYELHLGGPAPAPEGARYVEVTASGAAPKVVLVAKTEAEDLTLDLDAFRLRSLISVSEPDVTRISIDSPTLKVVLTRGPGKTFLVDGQPKVRADRETVSSLFFQLGRLSANHFLNSAQAESGVGRNPAHFELKMRDSSPSRFDAGGTCPTDPSQLVVLRRAPDTRGACVSRELDATLGLQRDAFLDQHAFSLHVDEVEELAIETNESKFRLVRQGTAFVLHTKTDAQVELEPGNQRITDVLEARGDRIENAKLNELGLDPAKSKVTLRSAAAREEDVSEEVVRVGNKDSEGNLFVYREQDGVTLKIPRDQTRAFALDSTLLYSRKLTEFGISSFISADITRGPLHQLLRRGANDALQLESPKGFEPDGGLAADAVQALGALNAERFVADSDDGSFGLSHPQLSVQFAFKTEANPKIEHTLRVGGDTALGVYATLDQNGPVFVLPRTTLDALGTLLVNRSVFSSDPESLNAFALEANGHTLRFERKGDHLEPTPQGSFPEDRMPDLLEALGNLRAEAGIHTGPAEPAEGMARPTLMLRISPKIGAPQSITFGAGDSWRETSVFYMRVNGVDATFVIAQSKVRALGAAF